MQKGGGGDQEGEIDKGGRKEERGRLAGDYMRRLE